MRAIRSLIGTFIGLFVLGAIASAIAAFVAKGRLSSSGDQSDDEFDQVVIYDNVDFRSTASAFRRGSVLTWYGGGTIDLRGATLDPAGATLELRTLFGGLQLVVPPSWRIEQDVTAIFGGIGDIRGFEPDATDSPVLRLTGWAAFGGIAIASDAPFDGETAFAPTGAPDEAEPAPAMA
jgi:predicted membrane protein